MLVPSLSWQMFILVAANSGEKEPFSYLGPHEPVVIGRREVPIRCARRLNALKQAALVVPRGRLRHRPAWAVLNMRRFRGDVREERPLVSCRNAVGIEFSLFHVCP